MDIDNQCNDTYVRLYGTVTLQEITYSVDKMVPTEVIQISHLAAHMYSVFTIHNRGVKH
jgi:hypothetical protein